MIRSAIQTAGWRTHLVPRNAVEVKRTTNSQITARFSHCDI